MKKRSIFFVAILLFGLSAHHQLSAQTAREALSIEDIRQWRNHSVTLSDDGQWYTTRYNLRDKPKIQKDTITEQKIKAFFDEDNQTNVLYISNVETGIQYKIQDGRAPKFSSASDWIAYQIKPESENEEEDDKDKKEKVNIELKHLKSGFTVKYTSNADYEFIEDKSYFLTKDENSLLIYDLDNRQEHYIGSVGEYIIDEKTDYIAYTISTKDKRGNGIYLFNPTNKTTRAISTGSYTFSNLSWNSERNSLAAYKYKKEEEEEEEKDEIDPSSMHIIIIEGIQDGILESFEYPMDKIEGLPEKWMLAAKTEKSLNGIVWSNDDGRLFLKIKGKEERDDEEIEKDKNEDPPSVQVWHWKDKKLLSERIMEHDSKQEKVFDAIFFLETNALVQLTENENQELHYNKGTDNWGIIRDFTNYISDWDVPKSDLYRINLNTGERKLIRENHSGPWYNKNFQISPDGKGLVYWDGKHYWFYDFSKDERHNITTEMPISFVDKHYDKYGYSPDYGFVGWVKDRQAILVQHEFDLWALPFDTNSTAQNLTASVSSKDSIRFRIEDYRFRKESDIEDRYVDLSNPIILNAFNTKTKYAGFYKLYKDQLSELIYLPASFAARPWGGQKLIRSKHSDAIIYNMGDYQNFPESYLSTLDFSSSKKITNTNPQQEKFKWGKRILVDYSNDDGVPLQAVLSIPEGYKKGQKLPMLVYSYEKLSYVMYRYPMPYLNGAVTPEMLLVSDGYLFLRPDIHFNVGTPHSDMHECIDAAIEKVIELGYVDEERIGYQGFSFGGHCGMYISTQENKFAAIAAGAGVSNLVQGFNIDIVRDGSNEQDYYMTGQGRLGADPTAETEMYISESPVFHAQNMNTPLLLFHGTDDKVVQWEHSFGFYSILRYLKKPVVFLSYRGEGHGLDKEENILDLQRRMKDYFDHYLKDAEAQKWMLEETPYVPLEESKDKNEDKRTIPKWK